MSGNYIDELLFGAILMLIPLVFVAQVIRHPEQSHWDHIGGGTDPLGATGKLAVRIIASSVGLVMFITGLMIFSKGAASL